MAAKRCNLPGLNARYSTQLSTHLATQLGTQFGTKLGTQAITQLRAIRKLPRFGYTRGIYLSLHHDVTIVR
jgi:hypothetical protein